MKLLSPYDYVADAAKLARRAKSRIYVISMVIADHPSTHELVQELENAAKRGVEVVVAADTLTFGIVLNDFIPGKYKSKEVRQSQRMTRELKKSGVKFHWLGSRRATAINGRTHTKWTVIDDTVYSFGGVNLYDQGVDSNVDYMFKLKDAHLADRIIEEQKRIQKAERRLENYPSTTYMHDNSDLILFDGGLVGRSAIYEHAKNLTAEARSVVFVSQYCPTGKLATLLRKKGESAELYFNHPYQTDPLNRIHFYVSLFVSRLKSSYQKERYLHAKFILFTFADGSKKALTGSHNFAYSGVLFGTREVALETSNPKVIAQLETFLEEEVKGL